MPWPVPPSPSSLTGTLIAATIALAILALFVTAITIRCTLSLYVAARRRGCVVASSMPSCQPPTVFVAPVVGWLSWASCRRRAAAVAAIEPPQSCCHRRHRPSPPQPAATAATKRPPSRYHAAATAAAAALPLPLPRCRRHHRAKSPLQRCHRRRRQRQRHHQAATVTLSGIRRKMLMNSFIFAESTVSRLDAMANDMPRRIGKDVWCGDDKVNRSLQCCDLAWYCRYAVLGMARVDLVKEKN
jgi:hypothetical protein